MDDPKLVPQDDNVMSCIPHLLDSEVDDDDDDVMTLYICRTCLVAVYGRPK